MPQAISKVKGDLKFSINLYFHELFRIGLFMKNVTIFNVKYKLYQLQCPWRQRMLLRGLMKLELNLSLQMIQVTTLLYY